MCQTEGRLELLEGPWLAFSTVLRRGTTSAESVALLALEASVEEVPYITFGAMIKVKTSLASLIAQGAASVVSAVEVW